MFFHQLSQDARFRLSAAATLSVALHAIFLLVMLWHKPHALSGAPVSDGGQGTGTGPIFVSLSASRIAPFKNRADSLREKPKIPTASYSTSGDVKTTEKHAVSSLENSEAGHPDAVDDPDAENNHPLPSDAEPVFRSEDGVDSSIPGSMDGDQRLLKQIASCFPAGGALSLPHNRLTIQVDGQGNLIASPVIDIDIAESKSDEIRAANTIIQAALLCGPYRVPPEANGRVVVLADFSQVLMQLPAQTGAIAHPVSSLR